MFKVVSVAAVGVLLGCLVIYGITAKYDIDISININKKASPYKIGQTKSGEPCRIVTEWGSGLEESKSNVYQFLLRNLGNDEETENDGQTGNDGQTEYGLKYDCFLDLDTQEYKLGDYRKVDGSAEFTESYVFVNRNKSAECLRFQYDVRCEFKNSLTQIFCAVLGMCTDRKPHPVEVCPAIFGYTVFCVTLMT